MKVVDLSAWQRDVNWTALVSEGIQGVILKLGEYEALDEMFVEHVNNAAAYGLEYGVYYYAHAASAGEAALEAAWVDKQVKTYLRGENPPLGIWYDAEDEDMKKGDITAACSAFIRALNESGYAYAGIYSSYNWLSNGFIDIAQLADYVPYWVAQYYREDSFKKEHPDKLVRMWQYTDRYSDDLPYDANVYYE